MEIVELVIEFACCGLFLAGLAALIVLARRSHARTEAAFARLARECGLTVLTPLSARGPYGRGTLTIELLTRTSTSTTGAHMTAGGAMHGGGSTSKNYTVYRFAHAAPLGIGLEVVRQTPIFGAMMDALGLSQDLRVGVPALDDAARIRASDARIAVAMLSSPELAQAVTAAVTANARITDTEIQWEQEDWITTAAQVAQQVGPAAQLSEQLVAARARVP